MALDFYGYVCRRVYGRFFELLFVTSLLVVMGNEMAFLIFSHDNLPVS